MSSREQVFEIIDAMPEYRVNVLLEFLQAFMGGQEDIPNPETAAAIRELENGGGELWTGSTEDLFAMLDAEDKADA